MGRPKSTRSARGTWQRGIYAELVAGSTLSSPSALVTGKARTYVKRYMASFHRLLARMEAEGWVIERTPGPRGGEWGARYRAYRKAS